MDKLYQNILDQIHHLQQFLDRPEKLLKMKRRGSQWTMFEHLEHLSITGRSTLMLIEEAVNTDVMKVLNQYGEKLFQMGEIPRGKTQSPGFAIPKGMAFQKLKRAFQRFKQQYLLLQEQLVEIKKAKGTSEHPILGHMTAGQWFEFLCIHQNHHLLILRDLEKEC